MTTTNATAVGNFFGEKWHLYQKGIRNNVLCHSEMFAILDRVLGQKFQGRPIRFVDFGCGDATAVRNSLDGANVSHYVGVDSGESLIKSAAKTLESLNCEKTLICQDMSKAVADLPTHHDVMFCSYSLHHLSRDEKAKFISDCYQHLNSPGYLIVIDGVASEQETREEWLQRLEQRFVKYVPEFTAEEIEQIMRHPRESDYPDSIVTFQRIAKETSWRNFEVLLNRDDFLAFMLFSK